MKNLQANFKIGNGSGVIFFSFLIAGCLNTSLSHADGFPTDSLSFVDSIVSYTPGADVTPGGGWDDPQGALGVPDSGGPNTVVSLGDGGTLVLSFDNNRLIASGNALPDLHIYEVGNRVENMNVAISENGGEWVDLGDVSDQPIRIDIDNIATVDPDTFYRYVRLTDISPDQSGPPYGEADIDAVGATLVESPTLACPSVILQAGVNIVSHPSPPPGLGCFNWLEAQTPGLVSTIQHLDGVPARFLSCAIGVDAASGVDFPIKAGTGYVLHALDAGFLMLPGCDGVGIAYKE
jgi:hypothetical protein